MNKRDALWKDLPKKWQNRVLELLEALEMEEAKEVEWYRKDNPKAASSARCTARALRAAAHELRKR